MNIIQLAHTTLTVYADLTCCNLLFEVIVDVTDLLAVCWVSQVNREKKMGKKRKKEDVSKCVNSGRWRRRCILSSALPFRWSLKTDAYIPINT